MSDPKQSKTILETKSSAQYLPADSNTLLKWILDGNGDADIEQALGEKFPESDHARMIREVGEHLQRAGEIDTKAIRGFCFEAYRELYRKMVEIGDFANALRALKQIEAMGKQ